MYLKKIKSTQLIEYNMCISAPNFIRFLIKFYLEFLSI